MLGAPMGELASVVASQPLTIISLVATKLHCYAAMSPLGYAATLISCHNAHAATLLLCHAAVLSCCTCCYSAALPQCHNATLPHAAALLQSATEGSCAPCCSRRKCGWATCGCLMSCAGTGGASRCSTSGQRVLWVRQRSRPST